MKQKVRTHFETPAIIAPVSNVKDIIPLLHAGAKEVYGGVVDPAWESTLGQYVEMNRRSAFGKSANLNDCSELCEAVRICEDQGAEFHLTLNALQIPQKYYIYLKPILYQFAEAGGKKVIVSDPSLITLVQSFELSPVISSCTDVVNTESAAFYKKLNCRRIIFPRYMLLTDIEVITKAVPDMEYEAFLMNGACRFHDGCCFCMHGTAYKGLCDTLDYMPYHLAEHLKTNNKEIATQQHVKFKQSYFRACGLCALYRLSFYVDSLKIVGRNTNLNNILSDIRLAKQNIEIAMQCQNEEEYLSRMIRPGDEEVRCRDHSNCYYLL